MRTPSLLALSIALVACASPVTPAPDAGSDAALEASLGACGLPSSGVCRGQTYGYCEGTEVVELDCASTGGRCASIAGADFVACLQPVGASCRTVVPHGSHSHLVFQYCDGPTAGCLQDREGGRCVADLGACVDTDIDSCRGQRIISNCRAGQAIAIDCASIGARCDAAARACVGVPLGAPCDRVRRRCAEGTSCQMNRGDVTGVCVAPGADAGADAAPEAGSDAAVDASSDVSSG
ncbi:MAG: hypothetical protein JNK05_33335 [Myxococcales bacterium]|nr:hypothetical protein [Myxococcales bacterium]